MARLVFRNDQTNYRLEQVPHRWGGIPDVSIASLRADTMDRGGGCDRYRHVACLNRFADADYQSSIWVVSSIHAKAGEGERRIARSAYRVSQKPPLVHAQRKHTLSVEQLPYRYELIDGRELRRSVIEYIASERVYVGSWWTLHKAA